MRSAVREALKSDVAPARPADRLTVNEAAAIARVSAKTVRNWLAAGEIKTYRAGRQLRVDRADLDRFMAAGPKSKAGVETPEQLAVLAFRRQGG